jgi:hypothetical protein
LREAAPSGWAALNGRVVRCASAVGRQNVIAGADRRFAWFAHANEIHPSIVWAKLKAACRGRAACERRALARLIGRLACRS